VPVDVIFSFDSEDYETPAADEGELWWAEALRRHGFTGCFCLVGELARALEARGRRDVLAALAGHEIAYHSDMHSAHPVHAEYLETMGWDDGVAAVLAQEARGVADVRRLTGQQPSAYCKPGYSWAPQAPAAMALLDIPVFCDAPFEWAPGQPLHYCGQVCLGYHTHFDGYFAAADRRQRMRADFLAHLEQRRRDGGVLVMYTHPCRLITAAFTDTFRGGINRPRSAWTPAPLRPRADVAALMADFDDFLGWVARETDARVITYRDLWQRSKTDSRWLDPGAVLQLAEAVHGPLQPRLIGGQWLSPAEQLGVLLFSAAWQREHGALPAETPVRPLLGPTAPSLPAEPGDVDATTLLEAAAAANQVAGQCGRVPASIAVGMHQLGPAMVLRALGQLATGAPERLQLDGREDLPELARRRDIAGLHFRNTWSIFAPEFEAPRLIQLAQLQTWSARPVG
jgi:hypothetical protein